MKDLIRISLSGLKTFGFVPVFPVHFTFVLRKGLRRAILEAEQESFFFQF